jgi:hypothetical protein
VLVLIGISGGDRAVDVPGDHIMLNFVLGNKVAVGSMNGNQTYLRAPCVGHGSGRGAVSRLERLLTHPMRFAARGSRSEGGRSETGGH